MRTLLPIVVITLFGASAARADEVAPSRVHLALGVNSPASWKDGGSFGVSLYAGVGGHHAIRANVARYDYRANTALTLLSIAAGGDGEEPSYGGHTTDVGVGWLYYPRGAWRGCTLELGVLRRARDHRLEDSFGDPEVLETRTTTYAGRAMIGWSWLFYQHVFLAVAVGLSVGHESGSEVAELFPDAMPVRAHVSRSDVGGEGLLRVGFAFDL